MLVSYFAFFFFYSWQFKYYGDVFYVNFVGNYTGDSLITFLDNVPTVSQLNIIMLLIPLIDCYVYINTVLIDYLDSLYSLHTQPR